MMSKSRGDRKLNIRAGHIELFVRDPLASRRFYEEVLGCQILEIQHDQFVWVDLNGLTLLLRPANEGGGTTGESYQGGPSGLVLYTENLAATRQKLGERGVEFLGNDGSEESPTFTDPDGQWFQLVDPDHQ